MQVERLNQEILNLPESHPAYRFLRAFIGCRRDCVGREASNDPVDQEWFSESEGRLWSYSEFAYKFLSFDIVLDGWLTHAAQRTSDEQYWLAQLPRWRKLLHECEKAAQDDNNYAMLPIVAQTLRMFALWEQCIVERDIATDDAYPRLANRELYPRESKRRRS
jgi:hypothetical protein